MAPEGVMAALRCIVYLSVAVRAMPDDALEELLRDARERNVELGVTGVLLYGEGTFMQCFEGPPEGVREAYARIRTSRQHWNIRELMNEPVERRAFKDWLMGNAHPTASQLLALTTADWEHRVLWSQGWSVPRGMQLLRLFWSQVGPAPD